MPPKRYPPANATINEGILLNTFTGLTVAPESIHYLRHAAAAVLLDGFDRGVTREFFVDLIDQTFNLNEHIRRFEFAMMLLAEAQNNTLTMVKLTEFVNDQQIKADDYRKKLGETVKLLASMPIATDTIN